MKNIVRSHNSILENKLAVADNVQLHLNDNDKDISAALKITIIP
jgi:hypothetical protein